MPTEKFTQQEFEAELPVHNKTGEKLWEHFGFSQGEHCYIVKTINPNFFIFIRSSIDGLGKAGDTGENSIRVYLTDRQGNSLSNKSECYITRVRGWQGRLITKVRNWYKLVYDATRENQYVDSIFKCKKSGPNEGRFFYRVGEQFGGWLT